MAKTQKKFKEVYKKHLKAMQKINPNIKVILGADGSPRSKRDEKEDMYKLDEKIKVD